MYSLFSQNRYWVLREQVAVVVASGVIGFVDNDVAATASVVALLVLLNTRKDW